MKRQAPRILDEYLAASARAGDARAFSQLAARWQPRLLAHAVRLTGERELARDAVQDAWADISRGLPGLRDAATYPAWAYRIVTRRCADRIRKAQRGRKLEEAYANEPKVGAATTNSMEAEADRAPLRKAMASLPPEQRATIALFYGEDLSVVEIAAALSVPPGTVKTRLMHARRKLRDALEGGKSDDGS